MRSHFRLALSLFALTVLGIATLTERPREAGANFSDSRLFDHREYWERPEYAIWTTVGFTGNSRITPDVGTNGAGGVYANPNINLRVGAAAGVMTSGALTFDATLPFVWGISNTNNALVQGPDSVSHPGPNASLWIGDGIFNYNTTGFKNCWETVDPFAASGSTEDASGSYTNTAPPGSQFGSWGRLQIAECVMLFDVTTPVAGIVYESAPSADMKTGFGFGCDSAKAITTTPKRPLALIYVDNMQGTPRWSLLLCKGGNATAVTQVLTGVEPVNPVRAYRVRLVYNPVQKYLAGVINGVEGGRITNAAAFPVVNSPTRCEFNVFMQTGTAAGASLNCAFWYPTVRTYYAAP